MIYACYKGMPDDKELARGANKNDDGAGICWMAEKRINWIKGLKSDPEIVKKTIKDKGIKAPFAIHFRSASIGGVDDDLTHPFPICEGTPTWHEGHAPKVLMHNGHLGSWKSWLLPAVLASPEECPDGPWSDSRALAHLVHLKGEGIIDFLIEQSRVMIMDYLPSVGWNPKDPLSYMRLFGTWVHDKDGGYYQSVQTYEITVTRGKEPGVSSCGTGGTPTCGAGSGSTTTPGSSSTGSGAGTTTSPRDAINVWTIEELEELAATLEREQADARQQLGGN